MADSLTSSERSERMSRIRSRDTKPELWVRRFLHARGIRFRLHRADLPGRPDLVLSKFGTVVLVQGCFWHGHYCQKGRVPATRSEFWKSKFEANRTRDQRNQRSLRKLGWRVLHIWECELIAVGKRDRALESLERKIRRST